jgi:hypothetical protein
MALVNPNIAMSFRQPEFQAPNALAQYAQIQQIQGGQRQAEVADMQLESLRRDRDVLGRIQAAIVAKGGPPDLAAAADEMIKSGKPEYMTQGAAIRQKLADQAAFAAYQSEFEPKAQNALGASPTGMDLSAGAQAPGDYTSTQTMGRVPGVVTTPIPESPPMNAMAPPPAAPANAMAGQPDVAGLEARYRRVANIDTPGAKAEAALLLKQIERAATATPADIKTMQALGYPITQAGYAAYRDAQRPERLLTPEEEAQQLRLRLASRPPGVNITNVQEKAESAEFGKLIVQQYDAISKQASVAARTLPSIEANLATLNKGLDTGFGTDAKAAGARVLGALGVKDAEKFATDTQTFQSNAISAVLQKQLEQKGPQTESDARRIEQIGAELAKTKDANRFILDLAKEQLRRDVEQRNFYTEWKKGPGKGSFNGAEDAWFAGEGGKSLFARPALKKYAVGAPSAASQIPTAATPARAAPAPAAAPANVITNPQFPGFSIRKP